MFEIEGYALIKKNPTKVVSAAPISDFANQVCRVMEFSEPDGGALILNPNGSSLAMIEACDISRKFRCSVVGDVITPPDLNYIEKLMYVTKATSRKGGYNHIVAEIVKASSIHKGEFCDSVIWAKQKEEEARTKTQTS